MFPLRQVGLWAVPETEEPPSDATPTPAGTDPRFNEADNVPAPTGGLSGVRWWAGPETEDPLSDVATTGATPSPAVVDPRFNEADNVPAPTGGLSGVGARPVDHDRIRRLLAVSLVGLLAIMLVGAEAAFIFGAVDGTKLIDLTVLLTPVTTLAGVALGWYFTQDRNQR